MPQHLVNLHYRASNPFLSVWGKLFEGNMAFSEMLKIVIMQDQQSGHDQTGLAVESLCFRLPTLQQNPHQHLPSRDHCKYWCFKGWNQSLLKLCPHKEKSRMKRKINMFLTYVFLQNRRAQGVGWYPWVYETSFSFLFCEICGAESCDFILLEKISNFMD